MQMDRKPLLGMNEAARVVGVSHWTLRRWAKAGVVPAVRVGRKFLFRRAELEAWLRGGSAHGGQSHQDGGGHGRA